MSRVYKFSKIFWIFLIFGIILAKHFTSDDYKKKRAQAKRDKIEKLLETTPESEIRSRMEKHLKNSYNMDLVVGKIDINIYKDRYYASVYKPIDENDSYYTGSVYLYFSENGLGKTEDSYENILKSDSTDQYVKNIAKKYFGDNIIIMSDLYEINDNNLRVYADKIDLSKQNKNIELDLEAQIFIFNNSLNKIGFQKQIFNFIHEIKNMGNIKKYNYVIRIIDERRLAPSANKYNNFLNNSATEISIVDGEESYIPIKKNRVLVAKALNLELKKMEKQTLIYEADGFYRSSFYKKVIFENHTQFYGKYYCEIKSLDSLSSSEYNDAKKSNNLDKYDYNEMDDIEIEKYESYVFVDKI